MIEGINPFHIVKIRPKRFRRRGMHPYVDIVAAKTPRWIDRQWLQYKFAPEPFGGRWVEPACVEIYGANNSVLTTIDCKNNAEAERVSEELNQQMLDFFAELGVLQKLRSGL